MSTARNRDDFSAKTRRILAERAGYRCSKCGKGTCGPGITSDRAVRVGVAAHIAAASPKGPRSDPGMTASQRKHPDNGIWLCAICAKKIDDDPAGYTAAMLREWRARAERRAAEAMARGAPREPLPEPGTLPGPGPLPPGSRLPFGRNALFTGREGALEALARATLGEDAGSTLVSQAVQGMGGVGKTQLAVEFAYRYGRWFDGVHWLNAREPAGIAAEIAACGERMGLQPWPAEQPEQVAATLAAWRDGGPRLVVLDNLEDVGAAREWLRRLRQESGARLLLTARRGDWPPDLGLAPLPLEVFSAEESLAFLRRYLPAERASDGELGALAERLGRLPLALELAGRYLAGHRQLGVG
ncbi:MAG: hypothetical protein GX597_07035, partial [Anaerolineaceae bacterium]|nr:hypothetical protein [Anaerolineaceae bacterium]